MRGVSAQAEGRHAFLPRLRADRRRVGASADPPRRRHRGPDEAVRRALGRAEARRMAVRPAACHLARLRARVPLRVIAMADGPGKRDRRLDRPGRGRPALAQAHLPLQDPPDRRAPVDGNPRHLGRLRRRHGALLRVPRAHRRPVFASNRDAGAGWLAALDGTGADQPDARGLRGARVPRRHPVFSGAHLQRARCLADSGGAVQPDAPLADRLPQPLRHGALLRPDPHALAQPLPEHAAARGVECAGRFSGAPRVMRLENARK